MAKRPANFTWLGFDDAQLRRLDMLDYIGNNAWSRVAKTEALMPALLQAFADEGVQFEQVLQAMADIGYSRSALHQLERWESKRITGRFGP